LQVTCLAVLIAAAVTISAINDIEEFVDSFPTANAGYENAGSYKGAAIWAILVAISAVIYHAFNIILRFIYYMTDIMGSTFIIYLFSVSGSENIYIYIIFNIFKCLQRVALTLFSNPLLRCSYTIKG